MSNLTGGRKLLLGLAILGTVCFVTVTPPVAQVLVALVTSLSAANAVEHWSSRKSNEQDSRSPGSTARRGAGSLGD